jgi:hypothetical protein
MGKRKLEDNWRRKNKRVLDFGEMNENTSSSDTSRNAKKQLSDKFAPESTW